MDMELDINGMNTAITAVVLPDDEMRAANFTDHRPEVWYFNTSVGNDISLNISINKEDASLRIDVLDENFLQPYDYQELLRLIPDFKFALDVKKQVETHLAFMSGFGIIKGFMPDMYV